jgi:hypothetical protein
MGSISDLAQELMKDETFIQDLARYSENLLTEKFIRKKYGNLDEATWTRLGENDSLIEKIEDLKLRRCRDGSSKREKAQQLVVKTVDVLGDIALNAGNSPKHRIDASKTLDAFAANAPQTVPPAAAAERFQIVINLGNDQILKFDKSIEVRPNDIDNAPQGLLPTNKRKDDSNNIDDAEIPTPWGPITANKQGNDGNGGQPL